VGSLAPVHDEQLAGVEDICTLSVVNDGAMLFTVRSRYLDQQTYTNVGRILIAVNPFAPLPIYSKEHMDRYAFCANPADLPPHIYGLGQDALRGLRDGSRDQAILISGESGAGKTESAKLVLSYVAEALKGESGGVEERILLTSPVLEAFGNAMTVRNNNSSRFGKWLDMQFSSALTVNGCSLTSYLLEVTRVCAQAEGERGFHIFFMMLQARTSADYGIASLKLQEPKLYRYLRNGKLTAPGIDDKVWMNDLKRSFSALHFEEQLIRDIFKILGGILTLGNVEFDAANDTATLRERDTLTHAARLLGISQQQLLQCITCRKIKISGELMEKPLSANQAENLRDSLSRLLYGNLFLWLIDQLNGTMAAKPTKRPQTIYDRQKLLGVLDIAGFESFEKNSLEQLLINLSNEHLQQQFNSSVFKLELEDYKREGIDLEGPVHFEDNAAILALIDAKGGVLDLLDEAVALPKATDLQYVSLVLKNHASDPHLVKPKFQGKPEFGIRHYAGIVQYTCDGFLEKNSDKPPDDVNSLVKSSDLRLMQELGSKMEEETEAGESKGPAKVKKTRSAASVFRASLRSLMSKIHDADPHYIRCVKPNHEKVPNKFTGSMVYEQLLFSGVIQAVRIRQQGYSVRLTFTEFLARYVCITGQKPDKLELQMQRASTQELLRRIQQNFGSLQPNSGVKVGRTKILMKTSSHKFLESIRAETLLIRVQLIQWVYRRYKLLRFAKQAGTILRKLSQWISRVGYQMKEVCSRLPVPQHNESHGNATYCAIKSLGSAVAVRTALGDLQPLLKQADSQKLRNSSVFEIVLKVKARMEQELDCFAELEQASTSVDPVAINKTLMRAKDCGMSSDTQVSALEGRAKKLETQLPLFKAMQSAVQENCMETQDVQKLFKEIKKNGLEATPQDWIKELGAGEMLKKFTAKVNKMPSPVPEEPRPSEKEDKQKARKTITGLGPAQQAKILHELQEAIEVCDIEQMEFALSEAIHHGLPESDDIKLAKEMLEKLHTEREVLKLMEEAQAEVNQPSCEATMIHRLQNLSNQAKKLQCGASEATKEAIKCAQFAARKTCAMEAETGTMLVNDIFKDITNYPGLKPPSSWGGHRSSRTVEANTSGMMKHSTFMIAEALTQVPETKEAMAVQNFRNVMIGMYDKPAPHIEVLASREAVMDLARAEALLRTEIYIQMMKQLTQNPSEHSLLMGWQMLHFLCLSAPPGPDVVEFVEAFAQQATTSSVSGIPDAALLRTARIPQNEWPADATVELAREANACLAALAQYRKMVVTINYKGALEMEDATLASSSRGSRCTDRCSQCAVL